MRSLLEKVKFVLLAFTVSLTGCHSRSAVQQTGWSSFELLEPPKTVPPVQVAEKSSDSDIEIVFIAGSYSRSTLKKPIYPSVALEAHVGRCVIYATVIFDETGHVSDISQSWNQMPALNRFADAFLDEVKSAVSTWTIAAPCNVYYLKEKDGNRKYLRTEPLSAKYDFRFIFEADGSVK